MMSELSAVAPGACKAKQYGVEFLVKVVKDIHKDADGFFTIVAQRRKEFREGSHDQIDVIRSRKVVLATGVMDRHPDVPNVYHWAGYGIYYFPDCDGYEMTGQRVVVIGKGNSGPALANTLLQWTTDLAVVNVDPSAQISENWNRVMSHHGFPVYAGTVRNFVGDRRDVIEQVIMNDGTVISSQKVFSALGMYGIHSELGKKLGVDTFGEWPYRG